MSLINIVYKNSYKSPKDDIINDFLLPSLAEAVEYNRAVGFFSSTALLSLSVGIKKLVQNNGKIRVVCSPKLSDEDIDAIKKGYDNRECLENIIVDAVLRDFCEPTNYFEEERYNILSHLISSNVMDLKIAFSASSNEIAMYHEKLGVIKDENGNFIAYTGSMNDSINAYKFNCESIDVFTSFGNDFERAIEKRQSFEDIWNDNDDSSIVIDFPDDLKKAISKYKKDKINLNIDIEEFQSQKDEPTYPQVPKWLNLREYQEEAIESWKNNNYIGIYDMATGTGKTITALASVVKLLEHVNQRLAIIICCPYMHLVDQWCEDLDNFRFNYIVGHSESKQKDWKKIFKQEVFNYSHEIVNSICLITTNSSFSTKFIQEMISNIKGDILIVIDEAHNFGTINLSNLLDEKYKYRLALSATLERHNDLAGTMKLYDFFNKKCIIYDLEKAISENKLTNYLYYPIKVYLSEDELEKYNEISKKLLNFLKTEKDGSVKLKSGAEMLLIKRARIVAGAEEKITKLIEVMQPYKNLNHILVYCGATTVVDPSYKESVAEEVEIKQIQAVQRVLSENLNMKVAKFTSEENSIQRDILKKDFANGDIIQALVAIRCLDEGVNIPCIETAIILASSTNPKEYIQRRGRVLRTFPNKSHAVIIDFVTLPRRLDSISKTDDFGFDKSLIKRELIRVKDFAKLALNSRDSHQLIDEIESIYGCIEGGNDLYEL